MEENKKIDPRLYDLVRYTHLYFKIDQNLDYKDNILRLADTILANPTGFLFSLTVKTFYFLQDCLEHGQATAHKKVDFYEDDFDLLVKLNIINIKTNMINPIFEEAIRQAFSHKMAKQIAYLVSLVKGMIDFYGVIEISKANEILKEFTNNSDKYTAMMVFANSNLLNAYALIKDTNFVHYKLENDDEYQSLIKYRENLEIKLDYKKISGVDLIKFAGTYNYEVFRPYFSDENFLVLFNTLLFNRLIHTTQSLIKHKVIDEEKGFNVEALNLTYPKWGLKGHTSDEYYKLVKDNEK